MVRVRLGFSLQHWRGALIFGSLLLGIGFRSQAWAQSSELPEIVVIGEDENDLRLKKAEINRIGTLKPQDFQKKQAQTFSQALSNERGVDTQTACAFCGAKRITINGFKGEHTTILIDGLPLHSAVSGFYGVDAIPLSGIDSIDIYRGSGAALAAPESIGGAVNIVTKEIVTTGAEARLSYGHDGQRSVLASGTRKLGERSGFFLGAQFGEIDPIDVDGNRVAEQARQQTKSVLSKFVYGINETDELSFRLSYGNLKTIGGSMDRIELGSAVSTTAAAEDFLGRDVRRRFIGDERKLTENVGLDRYELASIYRKKLSEDSSLKISLGGALQQQKAIYSHGYDYDNTDKLSVATLEYQKLIGENHLLTFGLDGKNQEMDSSSQSLYVLRSPPLKQDDLTSRSAGGFAQHTWFIDEARELSWVLRFDQLKIHWRDLSKDLDRSVIAPRLMYKHIHNPVLTSRLALGLGYRSPLTLFESQHGATHDGILIDINELETAYSFLYSLAGQRTDDFFEFSSHITRLNNMAYGVDRVATSEPTLFKNSSEPYTLSVFDLSYGRRITPMWTVEGLVEVFQYPHGYKEKLQVAAIDQRFSLTSSLELGQWKTMQRLTLVGERDLSVYGYNKHFNIAPSTDPLDPSFGGPGQDQKWQRAPTYFTVDLDFERKINPRWTASFSVLNLLDYTQTGAGDSPTTWHAHGTHFHLDNFHIWGPLRGRQIFLALKGDL